MTRTATGRGVLAVCLATALLATAAFLALAAAWQAPGGWAPDRLAADAARRVWGSGAAGVLGALTHLGDRLTLWTLGTAGAVLLAWRRELRAAVTWCAVLLGMAAWTPLLKLAYERPRPVADLSGIVTVGHSFPSGHSAGATVVYGLLAWMIGRRLAPAGQIAVALAALAVVATVAASRVSLQAHWLSDVLGGCAAGVAWLSLGVGAALAWERRHPAHTPGL